MSGRGLRSALLLTVFNVILAVTSWASPDGLSANPVESASIVQGGGGICYHTFPSNYVCPDSAARASVYSAGALERTVVTTTTRAGDRRSVTLAGDVDAVFLTKEATEKFLVSYYWAVDKAKAQSLMAKLTPRAP